MPIQQYTLQTIPKHSTTHTHTSRTNPVEAVPEVVAEVVPEVVPEAVSEAVPEVVAEVVANLTETARPEQSSSRYHRPFSTETTRRKCAEQSTATLKTSASPNNPHPSDRTKSRSGLQEGSPLPAPYSQP
jgi:hypothetical protein